MRGRRVLRAAPTLITTEYGCGCLLSPSQIVVCRTAERR